MAYTFTGLDPSTDYTDALGFTSVDKAGNESWPPATCTGTGTAQTLNPTPAEEPMSSTKTADIDAIVATCLAAEPGQATGISIGIVSPDYGYYNQSYGTETAVADYYRIASQTKTFTGTAVLMAVDAGRIALTDHLSDYVSGVAYTDPTIQQMLMMQSGVYNYENNTQLALTFELFPNAGETVDQIIALIEAGSAGDASEFAPGTAYYYTNSNHYMLALVLQATDPAGRSIDQIIQQDILNPLGMLDTYFQTAIGVPQSPYATGEMDNVLISVFGGAYAQDCSNQNPAFVWASGAIISQVSDMIKWGQELMNGTLLSPAMQELRMTTFATQPQAPPFGLTHEGPNTFGYGLALLQIGSWFGHDGSWLGYDSCTMFEPNTGTVITVYENFQTNGLLSLATIWYEIANYLYPESANGPGFTFGSSETTQLHGTLPMLGASVSAVETASGGTPPPPPPPTNPPVAFVALGSGAQGGCSQTWATTVPAGANCAVLAMTGNDAAGLSGVFNGATMEELAVSGDGGLALFAVIFDPSNVNESVTIEANTAQCVSFNTFATAYVWYFENAVGFGPGQTGSGESVVVPTPANSVAVGAWYAAGGFTPNQRFSYATNSFVGYNLCGGDATPAPGAPSVTLGCSTSAAYVAATILNS